MKAALFVPLFLGMCTEAPPIVSADVGCIWAKHIDVTTFQVDEMKKAPGTWRPLAIQIADQNAERVKRCF